MSTAPFGAAGFGIPSFDPSQWFAAFAPAQPAPAPADPFAWLRAAAPAPVQTDPAALANQWMTQIQQLATQFVGREAAPADIVSMWRSLVGENPFASTVAASAFMPMPLFGTPAGGRGPFDMPAFGYAREHQERMQDFAKAGAEFQKAAQAFQAIVAEAGQDAFTRFESLLSQRTADGKPLESSRALFDLWIDAAEDAYADVALGERFQKAFGEYVNTQMRMRAAMQREVELACAQWGIPGRQEVDGAHRKIAELQRELRRMRQRIETMKAPSAVPPPREDERPAEAKAAGRTKRAPDAAGPTKAPAKGRRKG